MQKLPENKTRKNLRIAQCVLYLIQIVLCTFTYVRIPNPDNPGEYLYRTVPDMLAYMGASFDVGQDAMHAYVPFYLIFFIIPIVGFFFCALDKQRNLKNIVSLYAGRFVDFDDRHDQFSRHRLNSRAAALSFD